MACAQITVDKAMITQYMSVTGADETVARNMLEAFNGNLEEAVNMFLEGGMNAGSSSTQASSSLSANAITSEDDSDGVRAPIPQQQAVLVEDQYHAIPYLSRRPRRGGANSANTVFDRCRDFKKETEEYEKQLQNGTFKNKKKKRLHELFRPPVDILHHGDFQSARNLCNAKKKWLLVNIQNSTEFPCQVLNRDVWSNKIVREILDANFLLWQEYHDSDAGLHYATFYKINNHPHIAVVDPRTGERMAVWENFGIKPTANQFAELATLFLSEHSSLNNSTEEPRDQKDLSDKKESDSVIDLCEDEQLEAAIQASLLQEKNKTSNEEETATKTEEILVSDTDDDEEEDHDSNDDDDDCVVEEPVAKKRKTDENENQNENGKLVVTDETSATTELLTKTILDEAKIMLRLPDGGRKQIVVCLTSTIKSLTNEVSNLGYPNEKYELIKSFPRQNISILNGNMSLKQAGLHKQETLFVQDR